MPSIAHRYVHFRFTSDTFLLVLAIVQMAALQFTMNRYHRDAVEGREKILVLEHKNELAIANHIKAATERWTQLHDQNPGLKTPAPGDFSLDQ